jgi:hypothetical protein
VVELLTDQYFDLNRIHDKTKASIAAIKSQQLSEEEKNNCIKKEEEAKKDQLSNFTKDLLQSFKKSDGRSD